MDDDDADEQIELTPFPYAFVDDDNQKLRCFIAEHYLNAEIDGTILIENMDHIFHWLKEGKKPVKEKPKPALRAVKSDA